MKDNFFIKEALKQAEKAVLQGEIPVGAVIVDPKNKQIVSTSHNFTKKNNILAHAEINAINLACQKLNKNRLDGYDIYVTLEPCAMCASAISLAKIRRLYFSCLDEKYGAVESNISFFKTSACYHKTDYYYGFMEIETKNLLKKFFLEKR